MIGELTRIPELMLVCGSLSLFALWCDAHQRQGLRVFFAACAILFGLLGLLMTL